MEAGVRDMWNPGEAFVPECPLCSATARRTDPAAQALDWGVRTAEARGPVSEFWDVMLAAEVFRAAPGSQIHADGEELDLPLTVKRGTEYLARAEHPSEGSVAREETWTYSLDTRSPPAPSRQESDDEPARVPVVTLPDTPTPVFYVPGGGVHRVPPTRMRDSRGSCCCFFKRIGFKFYKLPNDGQRIRAKLRLKVQYKWVVAPKYEGCNLKWEERTNVGHVVPPMNRPEPPGGRTTVPPGPGGSMGPWTDVTRHTGPYSGGNSPRLMNPGPGRCKYLVPNVYTTYYEDEPSGPATPPRTLQIRISFETGCEGAAVAGNNATLIFTQRTSRRGQTLIPDTGNPKNEGVLPPWR